MRKLIPFVVALAVLTGCRTKREAVSVVKTQRDSIAYVMRETARPSFRDVFTVEEVCDTITGKARFVFVEKEVNGDTLRVLLDSIDGLRVEMSGKERIIARQKELAKTRQKSSEVKEKEVIIKRDWLWGLSWLAAGAGLTLIVIYRKRIPFLRRIL
jgi:regulator of protease activity HflC (stomatin/prohibitin superfamily)